MGLFRKRSYITINRTKVDLSEQSELPTVPDGKWVKCPSCDKIVYKEDLGSLKVCPHCDAHFRINAAERLAITVDTFQELFEDEKVVPECKKEFSLSCRWRKFQGLWKNTIKLDYSI